MRFEQMNWFDVESYLENDDRLIMILGACEQHAYLSLLTDIKIPVAIADAAAQQTGVLVAPPLNFGISPYFLAYPGTVSLRVETMVQVVEDMIRSVYGQGFRRIFILNGHGGNHAVMSHLNLLAGELEGLHVRWHSWWTSAAVNEIAVKNDLPPAHANWLEAFPFTRLVVMPEGSKNMVNTPDQLSPGAFKDLFGDGSFGGTYIAKDEVMQAVFDAAVREVVDGLKFE